jgi:hypothetical protein
VYYVIFACEFKQPQMKTPLLVLAFATAMLLSCRPTERFLDEFTTMRMESIHAIEQGINTLQNQSEDWQNVVENLGQTLDDRIEESMTYSIPYIIERATQQAAKGVFCVESKVIDDVIYHLNYLRSELLFNTPPPPPLPVICITSPTVIDFAQDVNQRKFIHFVGYNILNKEGFTAFLVSEVTGVETDITVGNIGFPDAAEVTVSLTEFPDETLNQYSHLELRYNGNMIHSIVIGNTTIVPPTPVSAETQATNLTCSCSTHTGGDTEFDGNGPLIQTELLLLKDTKKVYAKVVMWATETTSDWTACEGDTGYVPIYTAPDGYSIESIDDLSFGPDDVIVAVPWYKIYALYFGEDFVTGSPQFLTTPAGDLEIIGDSNGNDVGVAQVKLFLNQLDIKIIED